MRYYAILCLMFGVLFDRPAFAEIAKSDGNGRSPTFLYKFGLDLKYLSDIRGFSSRSAALRLPDIDRSINSRLASSGTLGLARSEIGLGWYMPRGAGVEIVLRPDALNHDSNSVELDSRSGRFAEEAPSLHFLDEYRMVLRRPNLEAHVGVARETLEDFTGSSDLLGFGLRVQGPKKSFTAGFSTSDLFLVGSYGSNAQGAIGVGIDLLSGRDDRHDSRIGSSKEVGESPAKREPYWGGSANISLKYGDSFKLGLSVATVEERAEAGIRQIEWYQLALRQRMESSHFPRLIYGVESRHLRQNYDKSETKMADVMLTSFGLTSAIELADAEKFFLAVWMGTGVLHPESILSSSVPAKGLQTEIGWSWMLEDQLELTAAASREWRRDGNVGGGSRGGFGEGSSGRSSQSRFAVRVAYAIGDQI